MDQLPTLVFVLSSSVVVVEIIQEVDLAIKLVEEVTTKAKPFVQQTNGSDERGPKKIL